MLQKEIIIKIDNERVWFNPDLSISILLTNIPRDLKFRSSEDIFWKVEMLSYESEDKSLKVKIVEYKSSESANFRNQIPKIEVAKLDFIGEQNPLQPFDWLKLDPLLISYTKSKFVHLLHNNNVHPVFKSKTNTSHFTTPPTNTPWHRNELNAASQQHLVGQSIKTITDEFWIDFNDVQFMAGCITFTRFIKKIEKNIDFKIANDHILPEFDNIKYWFSKKLKTKKIFVKIKITSIDMEIHEVIATSKEIDLISPDLIESVKYVRTIALTKEPKNQYPDKSLFSADEIFSQLDTQDIEGNIFKQSEQDILDFLIKNNDVRNKKELDYLSAELQSENYPLRYTLHPNFGFLFLVEGQANNHFIWELLNSHATYIWTIVKDDKELQFHVNRIETIINTIRTNGREKYKREHRMGNLDADLVFRIINHQDIASDLIDEFPKWKDRLNELLT